jgi:hypothetical protein
MTEIPVARRKLEARAQALYEASNDSSIPWARRGAAVRDAWLRIARNCEEAPEPPA